MASQADFERVLERLGAQRIGSDWKALCPAHADRNPSLSISFENNKILFHCHAGCSQTAVLAKFQPIEVAHYDYLDENGKLLYQVVRYDNLGEKEFKQRRPGTNGETWVWKVEGTRRVLYHTEELSDAKIVLVTEGEKDVETLRSHGYIATCNAGGASKGKTKWLPEYSEQLRGKHIVIIPDNDEVGLKHCNDVAMALYKIAATVGVACVPEKYKDVSDWNPPKEALGILIQSAKLWTEEEPKDWRQIFHSYEEFETAKPLEFAVSGFLQCDGITAIAGLSGHGKTFVALSLARALLFGPGKLWNWFPVVERAERIIYLIPESTITPFKHRLKLMGLYEEIQTGRLLVRTLSKGSTLALDDKALLWAAKGAHVFLDTAIRFLEDKVDEKSGSDMARTLSLDLVGLLNAEARSVVTLFHAPKEFKRSEVMTLENVIRGSGELGAILATAWGIKQIDEKSATIFVQNIKPRDFEPCGPFELIMRPAIDQTQDLQMLKTPEETGALHEEQPDMNPKSNAQKKEAKAANVALYKNWIEKEPQLSTQEIRERFAEFGIKVKDATIRSYKYEVKK